MSHSLWAHGLQPTRLSYPWNPPGKNTGVGCHSFLQAIFPTQGSNCRQILYYLSYQGKDTIYRESSVQPLSRIWLFVTPWSTARQASLSITNSLSLIKFMSTQLVIPSSHFILCHPLVLLPSIFPSTRVLIQWVSSSHQLARVGASASASVFAMNIQDWFPLGLTGFVSLLSKGLSRVFSNTTVKKHQFFGTQLYGPTLTSIHDYYYYGKTIALTRQTFVGKVMSLLFNLLSRLVIAFLPRSKCLLISWLQSPSAMILELKKTKSVTVSIVAPYLCHEVMGLDAMVLGFGMLSFKPAFSLLFHFHQQAL